MSDKTARKFQKLRAAHEDAVTLRKAAAKAARAVRGLGGDAYSLTAMGSKAGVKALAAEIVALREERKALKRLAAFAERHHAAGKSEPPGEAAVASPGKKASKRSKPAGAA